MDPDQCLAEIRELYKRLQDPTPSNKTLTTVQYEHAAYELAEKMQAMDEWLQKGGFLPTEWSSSERIW